MASEYRGTYVAAGAPALVHAGAGWLSGVVASHAQAAAQTVTIYDNTAAAGVPVLVVHVAPAASPAVVMLTPGQAIPFSTGLVVDPGGCDVGVWAVGR